MPRLHILGAGTPTPSRDRFGSSFVLDLDGDLVMFDCGPGATQKLVMSGLWPTRISTLFFTHHHFDHNVDYPCFLLCRWDQNIEQLDNLLSVYGPTETARLTERLIGPDGAFSADINARINAPTSKTVFQNRGGSLPRLWPKVGAVDVEAGWRLENDRWRVKSARARHVQPYLDSLAWRLETEDRSFVFTGDTEPCDSVRALAEGADVLVAMCWDHQASMADDGEDFGQMGTTGAADLAEQAGVQNLVLVHSGAGLTQAGSLERGLGDVAESYTGRVFFAHELQSFEF